MTRRTYVSGANELRIGRVEFAFFGFPHTRTFRTLHTSDLKSIR